MSFYLSQICEGKSKLKGEDSLVAGSRSEREGRRKEGASSDLQLGRKAPTPCPIQM
jgi:hypothetical protein